MIALHHLTEKLTNNVHNRDLARFAIETRPFIEHFSHSAHDRSVTSTAMPALPIKLAALAGAAYALDNGFGRQPVMGFNTYNAVGCSPNQSYVSETIDELASQGFLKAGYNHFQVDCGWQGYERQPNGSITYDAEVFPDGIAPLSQYAIEKGFKWAMYTNQGVYSCDTKTPATRQGSLGYEKQDALQLAAWNVEYMKVRIRVLRAGRHSEKSLKLTMSLGRQLLHHTRPKCTQRPKDRLCLPVQCNHSGPARCWHPRHCYLPVGNALLYSRWS
jgi:hypothetical protein